MYQSWTVGQGVRLYCDKVFAGMPKLSCITTTYNDGPALLTSVTSVLNQTFEDFHYIIVDDGSLPETRDLVLSIKDPRLLVLTQANDGVSGARNKGLEQVKGDYVCFLDADDARPNWAFRAIADLIDAQDPDLILSRGILSEVRGDLTPFYDTRIFDAIEVQMGQTPAVFGKKSDQGALRLAQLVEPQPANKVVRTALVKRAGLRFPNSHFFEDVYFHTFAVAAAQRISFLHNPSFTYFRRYGRVQTTMNSSDLRMDIIPVTKMTLERFALCAQFHDPLHRAAVLASCFKILMWCEKSVSYHYRYQFRQAVQALLMMIDPLYLHLPDKVPAGMEIIPSVQRYIAEVRHA
jgi:glycosyltransferase involved in cell wall biosynthesis